MKIRSTLFLIILVSIFFTSSCSIFLDLGGDAISSNLAGHTNFTYTLEPPFYTKPPPDDSIIIKEIQAEGTSDILRDCHDANKMAIIKLKKYSELHGGQEVYSVRWYDFGGEKFISKPICRKSKGTGLVAGEPTKVRIKGIIVKKKEVNTSD